MKITLKMKYLPIYQIYFLQIPYNPIPKYDIPIGRVANPQKITTTAALAKKS